MRLRSDEKPRIGEQEADFFIEKRHVEDGRIESPASSSSRLVHGDHVLRERVVLYAARRSRPTCISALFLNYDQGCYSIEFIPLKSLGNFWFIIFIFNSQLIILNSTELKVLRNHLKIDIYFVGGAIV